MRPSYDFVVLGAGAAGCSLTRELARRHPNASIALVEQGSRVEKRPLTLRVPGLLPWSRYSRHSAQLRRTIQGVSESCLGGRSLTYTRGCGLGGSSLTNNMVYLRGTRSDFDAWNQPEWSYDAVLPTFMGLEGNAHRSRSSPGHGHDGPLAVADPPRCNTDSMLNVRFFEACEAAGIQASPDLNDGSCEGFGAHQSLIHGGERVDVFDALLPHYFSQERPDFLAKVDVLTDVRAHRLSWRAGGTRVGGVELVKMPRRGLHALTGSPSPCSSSLTTVEAGTVFVCLGALESPALLLRSGVGPAGATVDLPNVGANLIQGSQVDLIFRLASNFSAHHYGCSTALHWRSLTYVLNQVREHREESSNPQTMWSSFVEAAAFVRSQGAAAGADVQLQFFRSPQLDRWRNYDGLTFRVMHHNPRARGEVSVSKEDGGLIVRSGLLSHKEDVAALDDGLQWVGLLAADGSPLKSVYHSDEQNGAVGPFHHLQPSVVQPTSGLSSQRQSAAFLAEFVEPTGDAFGTCAMGEVVDAKLCVRGVDGLRVADASIVPTPTVASSSVMGAMIGARAGSFV